MQKHKQHLEHATKFPQAMIMIKKGKKHDVKLAHQLYPIVLIRMVKISK